MSDPELAARPLPALAFVAPSGTGKTTLLESVIGILVEQGRDVAVLKASHHNHELDVEGKDSWRFGRAGASFVGLCGPDRSTFFVDTGRDSWPAIAECARWFEASPLFDFDILLCEGFSTDTSVPKIRVVRGDWPSELAHEDLAAVAWDRVDDGAARPAGLSRSVALLPLEARVVVDWIREIWMPRR